MWSHKFITIALAICQLYPAIIASPLKLEKSTFPSQDQKEKCKSLENIFCNPLQLCPQISNFDMGLENALVGCGMNKTRLVVRQRGKFISSIERKSLECSEYEKIPGAVISVGDICYFQSQGSFYSPSDYCILNTLEALTCRGTFLQPKCCGLREAYSDSLGGCEPSSSSYLPQIGDGTSKTMENGSRFLSFTIRPYHLELSQSAPSLSGRSAKFYLQDSGVQFSPFTGIFLRGELHNLNGNYCVEQMVNNFGGNNSIQLFYDDDMELEAKKYALIVGVIWLVALPLDLATAFLQIFVLRRSVHGALLGSYLIAGASVNLMAAVIQFKFYSGISNRQCTFLDFSQKFMFISTLTWMTLLNFNMWIGFRKLHQRSSKRQRICCSYLAYLSFAAILPAAVVIATWKIGEFYRTAESPTCILYGRISLLIFWAPIIMLIIINFFLFLRTTLNIKSYRHSTEAILRHSHHINRKTGLKFRYGLFAKLFLMTGSIWIVRVVLLFSHLNSWFLTIGGVILELIFIAPEIIFFILIFADPNTWKRLRSFIKRQDLEGSTIGSITRDSQQPHLTLPRLRA